MNQDSFPAHETVKWYHHMLSAPLRLLSSLNLGPLGGENSISAIIEAVLAQKKGEPVSFPLSKSEKFFVSQLTMQEPPDEMIEYRELSHAVQHEIWRRWGKQALGVIWLGAGVFTLDHPLLQDWKYKDWHIWTDKSFKVVENALTVFQEMQERQGKLSRSITLPEDVNYLNDVIEIAGQFVDHIIIFGYGVTYALTPEENMQWLSQLQLPDHKAVSFVFNAPNKRIDTLPGVMASYHKQRMVYYNSAHIAELFSQTVPNAKIVWEMPRESTRTKIWSTWLVHRPATMSLRRYD